MPAHLLGGCKVQNFGVQNCFRGIFSWVLLVETGERHNQQTRFWCVLSSDDCTGTANTMSSTACRQKPWQALTPSATSPAYLRLCKISVFYFHAKEILVTVFFVCGEMCITCPGYLWWYKMSDLADHPPPRGWQAAGHWGGVGCPTVSFTRPPTYRGPRQGQGYPCGYHHPLSHL